MHTREITGDSDTIRVLLVGNNSKRAALLQQEMDAHSPECRIRRLDPVYGAAACLSRQGSGTEAESPDVILFDFAEAETARLCLVKALALGPKRSSTPVVILTSPSTEGILQDTRRDFPKSTMFAPTELTSFIKKMRQHSRGHFLRALSIIYGFGPILVRLPRSFLTQSDEFNAMSA